MNRKQRRMAARTNPAGVVATMLGDARRHYAAGRLEQARVVFQKLLGIQPDHFDALFNLGLIRFQMGEPKLAADLIGRAVKIRQDSFTAYNLYGLILLGAHQHQDALKSFDRAIDLKPDFAAAHNNRGNALQGLNRLDEALDSFDRALKYEPDLADALVNRGIILRELERNEESLQCYDRALTLKPDDAKTHYNRGNVLKDMKRFDEAVAAFDEAIRLNPRYPDAFSNRGNTLTELTRYDDAMENYERALELRPDFPECRQNLALQCLLNGKFLRGWEEYSARAYLKKPKMSDVRDIDREPLPANLSGKHVVVVKEQGLGDELFFLRFAPMLRARGAQVTYLADRRLVAMLRRAEIVDTVLTEDEKLGPSDLRLSVGDLPWLLGVGDALPPPPFPIPPLDDHKITIRKQLEALGPPPYVGVTWRAGTSEPGTIFKEFPFDKLAEAMGQLGAKLVAVQRRPHAGEVAALESVFNKPVLDLTTLNDDLEKMLALMDLLDSYVCVSNTNLHLRVANGKPSHVLVPLPYDFRWFADGPVSPWFPETNVYRQQVSSGWSSAFARLKRDLVSG